MKISRKYTAIMGALLAAASLIQLPAQAQTQDARPDLQGIWFNTSLTKLSRPSGV